jgi:hypothetical protein
MKKTPIALLAAATILASTAVIASSDGPGGHKNRGEHRFLQHDSNADGSISKDEYLARQAERFKEADLNKDGSLTKQELEAVMIKKISERIKGRMGKRFTRLDADENGQISDEEMMAHAEYKFEKKDHDGDHKMTRDEMQHGKGHMKGRKGGHRKGNHGDRT